MAQQNSLTHPRKELALEAWYIVTSCGLCDTANMIDLLIFGSFAL